MRRLIPLLSLVTLIIGCSSELDVAELDVEETNERATSDQQVLETCTANSCGDWTVFYNPDKPAVACILDAAASGQLSHVAILGVSDGGARCHSETRIFVRGDGTAYRWFARDSVCDDVSIFDEYKLERCQINTSAVESCQVSVDEWDPSEPSPNGIGTPSTPACSAPERWLEDCQRIEDPTCG